MAATASPERPKTAPKRWLPKRVLITKAAAEHAHGRRIAERCAALGAEVEELKGNRLTGLNDGDARTVYRRAKATLAVVTAPPSARKLQPIPPSADWQFHLARGCPAHCQYCYLAGSLPGPPVTRVYANLDEILDATRQFEGRGEVTSLSEDRRHEGTTFEASCYTDPLGIEHLTGSLATTIEDFARRDDVQLRFTTKFDDVDALAQLDHRGRTRARFSVNAAHVARRFEGGTATVPARLGAMATVARAGYPVGLTIAPIMPFDGWRDGYARLADDVAAALDGIADVDLTAELITHRFTETSKRVLDGWYPASALEMDEDLRTQKRTKFGGVKHVYPKDVMADLRATISAQLRDRLPGIRVLYFT